MRTSSRHLQRCSAADALTPGFRSWTNGRSSHQRQNVPRADGLNMTTYLGLVLLLVAYVLGSRLVIMTLGHGLRHSAQPGSG